MVEYHFYFKAKNIFKKAKTGQDLLIMFFKQKFPEYPGRLFKYIYRQSLQPLIKCMEA